MADAEVGDASGAAPTVDDDLLQPSKHRNAWTKCFVVKRQGCFALYTESSGRYLLSAQLVGDEFRIAAAEDFATAHDPARPNSGQPLAAGRYIAVCRRVSGDAAFVLSLFCCQNCDHRLGRYTCDPLASPLGVETAAQSGTVLGGSGLRGVNAGSAYGRTSLGVATGAAGAAAREVAHSVASAARDAVGVLDAYVTRASVGSSCGASDDDGEAASAPTLVSPSAGCGVPRRTAAQLARLDAPRQVLCEIRQGKAVVVPAGVEIRRLTVTLPRVFDDLSRSVWCPRNRQGSGRAGASPRPPAAGPGVCLPGSRRPTPPPVDAASGRSTPRTDAGTWGGPSPRGAASPLPGGDGGDGEAQTPREPIRRAGTTRGGALSSGGGDASTSQLLPPRPSVRADATCAATSTSGAALHGLGIATWRHRGAPVGVADVRDCEPSPSECELRAAGGCAFRGGAAVTSAAAATAAAAATTTTTKDATARNGCAVPPPPSVPPLRLSQRASTPALSTLVPPLPATAGGAVRAMDAGDSTAAGSTCAGPSRRSDVPGTQAPALPDATLADATTRRSCATTTTTTITNRLAVPRGSTSPPGPFVPAGPPPPVPALRHASLPRVVSIASFASMASARSSRSSMASVARVSTAAGAALSDGCDAMALASRLPSWDEDAGSLTMKFLGGRVTHASSKNFLLEVTGGADAGSSAPSPRAGGSSDGGTGGDVSARLAPGGGGAPATHTPCLQFGKLAPGRYSVDYRFPVAPLQAFAVFLAAHAWVAL